MKPVENTAYGNGVAPGVLLFSEPKSHIPIWEKQCLTLEEAAELYNIGVNRLRDLTANDTCPFVLFVGTKRLIKRKQFDQYITSAYSI